MPELNYLTIAVAAIVYFAIGALWYTALFGKAWMKAVGKTEEELRQNASALPYIGTFVSNLILCFVLALFIEYLLNDPALRTFVHGMRIAFMAWVGFVATLMAMNALFQRSSLRLYLIDAGYALVAMLISGGIIAAWV